MHDPAFWSEELLTALHRRVRLHTAGDLRELVTGQIDALVVAGTPMGYEDLVPQVVVVTEAGGRVSDLTGAPVLTGDGSVLLTNGTLHQGFLHAVQGIPPLRRGRS
jgi:histidinol-phosphatase